MPYGKNLISSDLSLQLVGESVGAIGNTILISQRIDVTARKIKDGHFVNSKTLIDDLRNIIKNYESMKPYIEILKKTDDQAKNTHNKLYGEPKKK